MTSGIRYRLRTLLRRRTVEDDLDAELRFHIEQETRKYVAAEASPRDAARRAALAFGALEVVKDDCRDVRGTAWIEAVWRDLRYAVRMLRRAPAFAATIVLTIALGIGINTAAFSVFNAYLLRPVPVSDPYSLYQFTWTTRDGRGHVFTWDEYASLRAETNVFAGSSSTRPVVTRINGRLAFGSLVTRDYFQLLGINGHRGRVFTPMDGNSESGAPPLAVLSHAGWTALFGADPDIVGRDVRIGGALLQVIGITPEGFTGSGHGRQAADRQGC